MTYVHVIAGSGGGGGGPTTLTGDVTGTGTGTVATTIASNAVTYSKIQTVAANKLLGNPTGSSAVPSEIILGTNLSFTGTTLNAAGGGSTFTDNTFLIENISDITKTLNMNLAGQTTATELTITPQNTSNMVLHIPQVATSSGAGMALIQDETTGFIFGNGITSSIGGANSMMQLANATTANRAQIKLHSYFNGGSVSGVSTLTSRSGTIGVNAAVVNGQDYSKWTAQAAATTPGSAPISGTWAFQANTVNSLTVTSNFHIQLTNLAGTLGDRFLLSSEGVVKLPQLTISKAIVTDGSSNLVSSTTTATEIGYVSGVTSSIQTQLNSITPQTPTQNQYYYVSGNNGDDSAGDGTYNKPFATIMHAMGLITTAGASNRFIIKVMSSKLQEPTDIILKGYVYIVGDHLDGSYIRINGGAGVIKPDPTTTISARCGIQNIYLGGGTSINWDLFTNGPNTGTPSCVFVLDNVSVTGSFTFKGRTPTIDFLEIYNCYLFGTVNFDACQANSNSTTYQGLTTLSSINGGSNSQYYGSLFLGGLTVTSTATYTNQEQLAACSITGGSLTITDAASLITFTSDSASYPKHSNVSITGTPTVTLLNDAYGTLYTPAVSGNWTTQPTTIQQALDMIAAKIGPI